jgi:hypothetical protein
MWTDGPRPCRQNRSPGSLFPRATHESWGARAAPSALRHEGRDKTQRMRLSTEHHLHRSKQQVPSSAPSLPTRSAGRRGLTRVVARRAGMTDCQVITISRHSAAGERRHGMTLSPPRRIVPSRCLGRLKGTFALDPAPHARRRSQTIRADKPFEYEPFQWVMSRRFVCVPPGNGCDRIKSTDRHVLLTTGA